jgi:hypothetical protein
MRTVTLARNILLGSVFWVCIYAPTAARADDTTVRVTLEPPEGILTMGEVPVFSGAITNFGATPLQGLVVYLSLISLKPGKEQPVDLEDWSADKTIRVDRLLPGATTRHRWKLRLIEAGEFGVVLTVVDPKELRPIVSSVVRLNIRSKKLLDSNRILPVAIGVPALLSLIWAGGYLFTIKFSHRRKPA